MKALALLLAACFASISFASAPDGPISFRNLACGKMSVSFADGSDGLAVTYGGVQIVRDSTLWIHNPAWNVHYYGLDQLKDGIVMRDVPGGKEAVITHRSDSFLGTDRILVKDRSVTRVLTVKLLKKIDDADMEYCLGTFCAAPILGRPFHAVMPDGAKQEGVVPATATYPDFQRSLLTAKPFSQLEIGSRIGTIRIEVAGDPPEMSFFDSRLSPYEADDKSPVFWAGVLGIHLEYGKTYTSTATITIDPAPQAKVAAPVAVKAIAKPSKELRSLTAGPPVVIPQPQEIDLTDRDFALTPKTLVVVTKSATAEDRRGAESFVNEMRLLYGFAPKVVSEPEAKGARSVILVGEAARNQALAKAADAESLVAPAKPEGYALKVTPRRVLVLGNDQRGSYYGMQTLIQLVKPATRNAAIQGCVISDWPALRFRGVHLFTGNRALPFHEKLIDRVLSRFKMNSLVLEVDYMKWLSHPELAVDFSEDQGDVRKEIDFARDHFMQCYPLLQSLGHSDHLFTNGLNRDMAENPDKPYAYCPNNPKVYPLVFKLYDETLDLFGNPEFVHIGHDEVNEPGGFPRHEECKKRTFEEIFVDDVLKVRDHVAQRGAKVMLWGDMMLAKGDSPDATNAKSPEQAKWIRDRMPKDVMVGDWHYEAQAPETYKSIGMFTKEGHDTVAATWYTPGNIEAFSKAAKDAGAMGLLQTTWAGTNSSEDCLRDGFIQFSAMVLAAEYAWDNGRTSLDDLPYKWDEVLRRQWNPEPVATKAARGFTVDLSGACNVCLADSGQPNGWLGLGADLDLSAIPTGMVRLGREQFKLASDLTAPSAIRLVSALDGNRSYPASVTLAVDRKAHTLLFLHTTAWTGKANQKVGAYRIRYADGTSVNVDLAYGVNIGSWIDKRSINGASRVWEGRAKSGQKLSLHRLEWKNPNPEKTIASVEFVSDGGETGPVLVGLSGLE